MQTLSKNWNWKEDLKQFKEMLKLLLPKGKAEIILFIVFFLIYGVLALFFATQTHITDRQPGINDAYFSFDNILMSHRGVTNLESHPLINRITFAFIYTGIILNFIFATAKAKAIYLVFICAFLVSSSNIYIYRYIKEIISLKGNIVYLITVFYAMFSTNIWLGFTFESFTFSLYILTFILYYYSLAIKEDKRIPFINNAILAILAGGITITNFAKGIIPILFLNESKKTIIKRILIIGSIFSFILLLLELSFHIFSAIEGRLSLFVVKDEAIYKYVIDMFLGAPILLPSLVTYYPYGTTIKSINIDFYHYWWQYTVIGIIGLISFLGIIKNYKNKLIYIPVMFFSVDIFLHIFIKYGINEGMIYGGNWIFIIPIFIGWLCKSLTINQQKALSIILFILLIIISINNVFGMYNFINLAMELFPNN